MNGYVEAGYVIVLGTLSIYSVTLVARECGARRRVGEVSATRTSVAASSRTPDDFAQAGTSPADGPTADVPGPAASP